MAEFQAAHSALARQIDTSDAFNAYADWLDGAIDGDKALPADVEALGAWKRQVAAWAARIAPLPAGASAVPDDVLAELIEAFAGVDVGVPIAATWALRAGAASGETAILSAANKLDPDNMPADPVAAGLVRALQDQGIDYEGYAHSEAAAARDEQGQPARAWAALNSAAWWMARRVGEAPPAIVDAARLLADRHGWVDIRWTIDRASGGPS